MSTAIVYYSQHHGNTKKLLDAIKVTDPSVEIIDVISSPDFDLSSYDRIGFASGIYFSAFAKQIIAFADAHLPVNKSVFYIYTHGALAGNFLKAMRVIANRKNCQELGEYRCQGFDTFGPFKLVGGIAKGHPTEDEIKGAVEFYKGM